MSEECLNASKRRKIEETVLQILQASDLETVTEFGVRSAAAVRLGFELSGLNHRLLVRQLVDSFLLSTATEILRTSSLNRIGNVSSSAKIADYNVEQRRQKQRRDVDDVSGANYDGTIICKLSDTRRVTVHDFMGATVVSIRDFYAQDGNMLPVRGENTGISLTSTQWSSFRSSVPSIEEAIVRLQARLSRHGAVARESKADIARIDSASEKSQAETSVSKLASAIHLTGKRTRNQSEEDLRISAADPIEEDETRATYSNYVSIVEPHDKSEQTEVDTSDTVISSISQEHIPVEKVQEAPPDTCGTPATSSYQERIPACKTEAASENSTLVPPLPNQLDSATALSPGKLNLVQNEQTDIGVSMPSFPSQRARLPNQLDSATALSTGKSNPVQSEQTDVGVSTSVPSFPSQRALHHTAIVIPSEQLIPIQPARFDGRNYHSWRIQMEIFLNQLSIAYVLSEQCPNLSLNAEASFEEMVGAKAATQRWITDDYLCRHNILNSLCDSLFQLYSQKGLTAGELWQELKAVYNEDFGNKRSQINKYIHFQMVDGVSIFDQIQELHKIADSIIASGTWIEEYFHTSVIVCKLPPSWKEFRLKLMQEEFLTLNMLMHRLCVEVESRNICEKESNSKKDHHATEPKLDRRYRTKKDENKRGCFTCGKEGHVSKYCPDRKFEPGDKSKGKENGFLGPCTSTKLDDADKRACFICGKDGHTSNRCRSRKFKPHDKSNGEENGSLSPRTGTKMDDADKRACVVCGKDGHTSSRCRSRKFKPCDKSNGEENGSLFPRTGPKIDDAAQPK